MATATLYSPSGFRANQVPRGVADLKTQVVAMGPNAVRNSSPSNAVYVQENERNQISYQEKINRKRSLQKQLDEAFSGPSIPPFPVRVVVGRPREERQKAAQFVKACRKGKTFDATFKTEELDGHGVTQVLQLLHEQAIPAVLKLKQACQQLEEEIKSTSHSATKYVLVERWEAWTAKTQAREADVAELEEWLLMKALEAKANYAEKKSGMALEAAMAWKQWAELGGYMTERVAAADMALGRAALLPERTEEEYEEKDQILTELSAALQQELDLIPNESLGDPEPEVDEEVEEENLDDL